MNLNFFAEKVSQLTEPMYMALLVAILAGWHFGLQGKALVSYVLFLGIVSFGIYLARVRFMRSMHTNWDVSDRPKRVRLLLILLGFTIGIYFALDLWHSIEITHLFEIFIMWLLGFFLITLKTKISGHIAILTLSISLLTLWFGWAWAIAFLLLPFVAWSRLQLKRHTPIEVIGGFVYSLIIVGIFIAVGV